MNKDKDSDRRVAERKPVVTKVLFTVNDIIIEALSADVSETGIRFDTEKPFKILLEMKSNGKILNREAQIVWAKRNRNGGMAFGFEYVPFAEAAGD